MQDRDLRARAPRLGDRRVASSCRISFGTVPRGSDPAARAFLETDPQGRDPSGPTHGTLATTTTTQRPLQGSRSLLQSAFYRYGFATEELLPNHSTTDIA